MADSGSTKRGPSDILDAIFDRVADQPARSDAASILFRQRALERLDVADEVDNQLPLVSRRSWLLVVGLAMVLAAVGVWMALTPSVTAVTGPGRVVGPPGVIPVVSPVSGTLDTVSLDEGAVVAAGDVMAVVATGTGNIAVLAPAGGTVWQVGAASGVGVEVGTVLATVLPPGSESSVLLAVPESAAVDIETGMKVNVSSGQNVTGTVTGVANALPAADAGSRVGLPLEDGELVVVVTVDTNAALQPGALAQGQVVVSDETVLRRLLGGS
jgi:multidrug resistance efflux pump